VYSFKNKAEEESNDSFNGKNQKNEQPMKKG